MPAVAERRLSVQDFHARYDGEKPYFEYWDGEAVQKAFPTRLHSLVQEFLVTLLGAVGFDSGFEITIKIDSAYEVIPDVIAAEGWIGNPYPTEPFEVVAEVLVSEDSFSRVLQKCRLYHGWGIRQIIVVDPQDRVIWSFENGSLGETDIIARRGEQVIAAQQLWAEVDGRLHPPSAQ